MFKAERNSPQVIFEVIKPLEDDPSHSKAGKRLKIKPKSSEPTGIDTQKWGIDTSQSVEKQNPLVSIRVLSGFDTSPLRTVFDSLFRPLV